MGEKDDVRVLLGGALFGNDTVSSLVARVINDFDDEVDETLAESFCEAFEQEVTDGGGNSFEWQCEFGLNLKEPDSSENGGRIVHVNLPGGVQMVLKAVAAAQLNSLCGLPVEPAITE